ncbi:MAG: hypothetical protein HYW48_08580 [Deltaproteobacteria bacterium]|nr:hypothetical protein [Deltaproteobacteria bacterium]
MANCSYERLKQYLDAYGWVYRFDGSNVFYSGWRSVNRTYSLRVEVKESFILFEVKLLGLSELLEKKHRKNMMEYLVQLNQKISVAKLGMSDDGMVLLLVEVFNDNFSYDHLSKVLGLIGYYSEMIHSDILEIVGTLTGQASYLPRYLI